MRKRGTAAALSRRHLRRSGITSGAVGHDRVYPAKTRGRFAQRPGRQQPAVAQPARAVEHADFEIPAEPVVLQAVVAYQHAARGGRCKESLGGSGAVDARPDLTAAAASEQHGLVAERARIRVRRHAAGRGVDAAVAAADDAGPVAARAQALDQPQHGRGLAGASRSDVADDDHRYRQPAHPRDAGGVGCASQRGSGAKHEGERGEQGGNGGEALPVRGEPMHREVRNLVMALVKG